MMGMERWPLAGWWTNQGVRVVNYPQKEHQIYLSPPSLFLMRSYLFLSWVPIGILPQMTAVTKLSPHE